MEKTWSDLKVVCPGNDTNGGYTAGNPAPVQLKYNQRILLPFCKNNAVPMQTYSDDDGLTFSPPEVIHNITKPDWKWDCLRTTWRNSIAVRSNYNSRRFFDRRWWPWF